MKNNDKLDTVSRNIAIASSNIKKINKNQKTISRDLLVQDTLKEMNINIEELVLNCKQYNKWNKEIATITKDLQKTEKNNDLKNIINIYSNELNKFDTYIR
jgi:DNA-binding transcriptional regulator GbsR (MarR family)